MCGFYLNELLLRLLPRDDSHEALFDVYGDALAGLAAGSPHAAVLRSFEKRLLAELGYAPLLERDAASGAPIGGRRYVCDRGPMPSRLFEELSVSGRRSSTGRRRADRRRRATGRACCCACSSASAAGQNLH
jgi:DNA repair protein RecO (recombination protein O)